MADRTKTIDIVVNTDKAEREIDQLNQSLKENQQETKEATQEQKKYEKQLDDTSDATGGMVDKLDDMTGGLISTVKGLGSAVKGLKTFKIALAATGIGAIIVAVGTLTAAFRKLQGPMSLLEDVTAAISAAFDEALKSLKTFGDAAILFFQGNYQAAIGLAVSALKDIKTAAQDAFTLSQEQREFNKEEAERLLRLSEMERRIEQLKLVSEDQTKTQTVRIKAANEAYALQQERVAGLVDIEKQRIDLARQQFELGTQTDQARIDLLNLEREGNEKIATLEGQLVELSNSRNALTKEINTSLQNQLQLLQDINDEAIKLDESFGDAEDVLDYFNESLDETSEFTDQLANTTVEGFEQMKEAANDFNDETKKNQVELTDALGVTGEAAQGVLDIFAGKTTGKDIFKFFLTTLGSILSLTSKASGAGGIFNVIGGLFADGGLLKGPSHSQGGIWVNAEGGEGIINKRSMSIPWVRQLASDLNEIGGGVKFADGGVVPTPTAQEAQIAALSQSLQEQRIVLPIPDLQTEVTKVTVVEERATL